jgi:glucan phosphoethanolaminetransferase (alkaline phosphatase superfamily)
LPRISATAWLLPAVALLAGVLGVDAVWVAIAVASNRPCSWLAMLAALDVALLLRLTGVPPGFGRQLLAVLATALAVALAQWLIVATQLGIALGLQPVPSALRLGPSLAIQLMKLSLDRLDLVWLLASLPLAILLAARSRRERQLEAEGGDAA